MSGTNYYHSSWRFLLQAAHPSHFSQSAHLSGNCTWEIQCFIIPTAGCIVANAKCHANGPAPHYPISYPPNTKTPFKTKWLGPATWFLSWQKFVFNRAPSDEESTGPINRNGLNNRLTAGFFVCLLLLLFFFGGGWFMSGSLKIYVWMLWEHGCKQCHCVFSSLVSLTSWAKVGKSLNHIMSQPFPLLHW